MAYRGSFLDKGRTVLTVLKGNTSLDACPERLPGLVRIPPHTSLTALFNGAFLCPNLVLEPFQKLSSREDYSRSPSPRGCQIFYGRKIFYDIEEKNLKTHQKMFALGAQRAGHRNKTVFLTSPTNTLQVRTVNIDF